MFLLFSLSALAFLLSGCGKTEEAPPYNRLRNQIVIEMFQALREGNPALALNQLDRIRAFAEDPAHIDILSKEEQKRLLIHQINRSLEQNDLAAARSALSRHVREHGAGNYTEKIFILLEELSVLEGYIEKKNHADTRTLEEALQHLIQEIELIAASGEFRIWLDRQVSLLAAKREMDRQNAVNLIVNTFLVMSPFFPVETSLKPGEGVKTLKRIMEIYQLYGTKEDSEASNEIK